MALSRPLMKFTTRGFGTTAARLSADAHHGSPKPWKLATILICVPVVAAATFINLGPYAHHEHRPEFVAYDYMRIRNKPFPWGDGNKTLFHNPVKNALPDGYETEHDEHQGFLDTLAVLFKK